jgi:GNAT superfamily N-acetyltransferase
MPAPTKTVTRIKLVGELTAAEYRACSQLNRRHLGLMRRKLVLMRSSFPDDSQVVLIEDGASKLLAWALVFPDRRSDSPGVYFYVRRDYRRYGLGRKLLQAVCRQVEKPRVYPWDARSQGFFNAAKPGTVQLVRYF